jgi:hypothetical protein
MTPDFQRTQEEEDLSALRRCPKSDLHNHFILGGMMFGQSVSEEFLGLRRATVFTAAELDEIRHNGLRDDRV